MLLANKLMMMMMTGV